MDIELQRVRCACHAFSSPSVTMCVQTTIIKFYSFLCGMHKHRKLNPRYFIHFVELRMSHTLMFFFFCPEPGSTHTHQVQSSCYAVISRAECVRQAVAFLISLDGFSQFHFHFQTKLNPDRELSTDTWITTSFSSTQPHARVKTIAAISSMWLIRGIPFLAEWNVSGNHKKQYYGAALIFSSMFQSIKHSFRPLIWFKIYCVHIGSLGK